MFLFIRRRPQTLLLGVGLRPIWEGNMKQVYLFAHEKCQWIREKTWLMEDSYQRVNWVSKGNEMRRCLFIRVAVYALVCYK